MYADNCEGLNSEEQLEQGHSAANLSKEWINRVSSWNPWRISYCHQSSVDR